MESLYRAIGETRPFFRWKLRDESAAADAVQDTFLATVQAILKGEPEQPESLMAYVWTIIRRKCHGVASERQYLSIEDRDFPDHTASAEDRAIHEQRKTRVLATINTLSERDQEVLRRRYLTGETTSDICREMDLTDAQFRVIVSRARTRLTRAVGTIKAESYPAIRATFAKVVAFLVACLFAAWLLIGLQNLNILRCTPFGHFGDSTPIGRPHIHEGIDNPTGKKLHGISFPELRNSHFKFTRQAEWHA